MKVSSWLKISPVVALMLAACVASAGQSLGDAARKAQANKGSTEKHAKIVTNDDLADPNRIVRPPESLSSDAALNQNSESTDSANKSDEEQKTDSDSDQDQQKLEADAKAKV